MAIISIDMANAESAGLLPEGEYQAFVYDVAQKANKAGDGFYLNWQFKVHGGNHEGKTVYHITSLKDNAIFKLRELLVAINYPLPADGKLELDTDDLISKKCTIIVGHREFNNRKQAEIRDVLAPKDDADPAFKDNDDY